MALPEIDAEIGLLRKSSPDRLGELVAEIRVKAARKAELEKTMKDYGLNLK